jgi:uncharacterized protein YndB with AHSA1/START domain
VSVDRQVRQLAAAAESVWAIVGDATALPQWFPSVQSCRMEGAQRVCELHSGAVIVEQILVNDPERRVLQYRITEGLAVDRHLGTVEVTAEGDDRCSVSYTTELEPDDLMAGLALSVGRALGRLADLCEPPRIVDYQSFG